MQNVSALKDELKAIQTSADSYFKDIDPQWRKWDGGHGRDSHDSSAFLRDLPAALTGEIADLESRISQLGVGLANLTQSSALLSSADLSDLRINVRRMVSALSFKEYQFYETHLMTWEDSVYGVRPASQREDSIDVHSARDQFNRAVERVRHILLFISPERDQNILPTQVVAPISGAQQRSDTAFIMMWISDEHPELEDVKAAIVEVFGEFHIKAIRADDIEHDDVITDRIVQEIASAEFLIADLTGARPNVYYEVGYAHALGKRVILYRKRDSALHFDLAGRNVPAYVNVSDLKQKLRVRLTAITGLSEPSGTR